MEYAYEVPVTVYYNDDEGEHLIPTKKDIVETISRRLSPSWRDWFIEEAGKVTISAQRDRMIITVSDDSVLFNKDVASMYRLAVEDWMKYCDFGGGFTLMGRFYNYPHDEVTVYTIDSKLPITLKTRAANDEPRS